MNRNLAAVVTLWAMLAAGNAVAGKVNMPKEGSYEFDFCPIGHGKTFSAGDKFFVMNYDLNAIVGSTQPGQAFDRMVARSFGMYANVNDHQPESTICVLTYLDVAQLWMDQHGKLDRL